MVAKKQIKCDDCDGEGKIRCAGIDLTISSTAYTVKEAVCPKCKGKGELKEFVETKRWLETLDGERRE